MNSIDTYIQKARNRDGGIHGTKAYPFNEDSVILVAKPEENFIELKNRIDHCKSQGVNIPRYIDYKYDGENHFILEELAPGTEFAHLVRNDNITKIFDEMPYEHMEKYIRDVYVIEKSGIGIEPRKRNIIYDKDIGFTTIDVGLLQEVKNEDSIFDVNYFFSMFAPVFSVPFSDDEYGKKVRKKTILNTMKAFENGHPFFNKYKRFIYRADSYFSSFLESQNVDLHLNMEENKMLVNYINQLIDNLVQYLLENPEMFRFGHYSSAINFLDASIRYCKNFDLFDLKTQKLKEYVNNTANNKIKELFFNNVNDKKLEMLYFEIRMTELDPDNIYYEEPLRKIIEQEIASKRKNSTGR